MTTPTYSRGDVVLVPVQFTDQSGSKKRPAVVVSSDDYNQKTPDVLIVSVTGNLAGLAHPGDHILTDWQAAGLKGPSKVQTKIVTVEATVISQKCGKLTDTDLAAVENGLREALHLMP